MVFWFAVGVVRMSATQQEINPTRSSNFAPPGPTSMGASGNNTIINNNDDESYDINDDMDKG